MAREIKKGSAEWYKEMTKRFEQVSVEINPKRLRWYQLVLINQLVKYQEEIDLYWSEIYSAYIKRYRSRYRS